MGVVVREENGVVGIMMARLLRRVMEEAKESHLFEFPIWVTVGESSTGELQRKIGEGLGIRVGSRREEDAEIRIKAALEDGKIFLILNEVHEPLVLGKLGIYEDQLVLGSKVVIVTPVQQVCSVMETHRIIEEEGWESLSEEDAWDLLVQEAIDVAANLPGTQGRITGEVVMECWVYCLLFPHAAYKDELIAYWITEGFISGFGWVKHHVVAAENLLDELKERCMLQEEDNNRTRIPNRIASKIFAAATDPGRGGSNRHRILARCELGLKQPPEIAEWEDKERISLCRNQIERLSFATTPPKCSRLTTLLLDHNPLREIPDLFFEHMKSLRVLDLSVTNITSLPSSLSCLCNLRMLSLQFCPYLETLPLPLIQALTELQYLDLYEATIKRVTSKVSFENMPNLHVLDISTKTGRRGITQLSLRGCGSLELFFGLYGLENLEVLDLSGTKIKEFPRRIAELKRLRRLDLLDTKYLTTVDWNAIRWLPKELNWNQCCFDLPRQSQIRGSDGHCISVSDTNIFKTLDANSHLWEGYFQKFYFYVCACEEWREDNERQDSDDPFERDQFYYSDIFAKAKIKHRDPSTSYSKCLEVHATKGVFDGIGGILFNTEFFSLQNNHFIITLSDLGVENMGKLIECRIEKCHQMESFIVGKGRNVNVLQCLRKLWVYHVTKLTTLCKGIFGQKSFTLLNHIYLESCQGLVNLFSLGICFEKLQILELKFCRRLETLFQEDQAGQDAFPLLHTLWLWELPKLKSICNGYLPTLEKLRVKGCPKLRKLPLHVGNPNTTPEVSGETNWWNNLVWEDMGIKNHIRFQDQDPFSL
ncbi:putative disease resistance protein At1g61300 [Tasmannia lanceolata]|uniref:putative disease resistance protein At1g61300 n=1 Tax=Tasmannia lanceolata TaxID=3420 RepID=UPI004064C7DC